MGGVMKRVVLALFGMLFLTGCVHRPVDCAGGIAWSDCLFGTAGNVPPAPAPPTDDPDDAKCRSYGLKYGTGDYAQCRITLEAQHKADARSAGGMPRDLRP